MSESSVLVTGSTRGIGRAIAALFLEEGATVGVHGRSLEAARACAEELGRSGRGEAIALAGDFSEPHLARELVQEFAERAGRLDGLVNNAGGGKAVAFRGVKLENWRETFARNLDAAMLASQEAYKVMRTQRSGSIVNMASLAAHGPGRWMGADYAASKAGLVSLTRSLAFEAARFGIRVNAISPGMIETDMTSALPQKNIDAIGIPLGRMGRAEEIARAAHFLMSPASAYMTGQVLHVDGGLWMGS